MSKKKPKSNHKRFVLSIDCEIHSSYLSVEDARFELPHIEPHYPEARLFRVTDSKTGIVEYKKMNL
jgi:hypothetical protein